jgi:SAM-dependent methyltransferase
MSESEIARLRTQLELEHTASVWALTGLASGTAQHTFITAKLKNMDRCYQQLHTLVGEERATDVLCDVFDHLKTSEPPSAFNRLDLRHHALRLLLPGNLDAPLAPSALQILDVGCGTGRWVCEMAQTLPQAQVTGLDLDLAALPAVWPANCQFITGNVLRGLPFASETFDVVHQRFLAATLSARSWVVVIRELVRVTRPGGWLELVELGQSMSNPGPATCRYLQWWRAWEARTEQDTTIVEHLGTLFQKAGLHQVRQRRIIAPVGQWGGQAGTLLMTDLLESIASMSQPFCSTLHISPHDFSATIEALPAEWEQYHTALHFYLAYGQK